MKRGKYFIPQLVVTIRHGQLGYEKTSIHFIINLANVLLPYRYEVKKLKKFSKKCRKSDFLGQCYAEEEKISIIFTFNLTNGTFISLYGVKEELDCFRGYGSKSSLCVLIWCGRTGNVLSILFLLEVNHCLSYRYEMKEVFSSNGQRYHFFNRMLVQEEKIKFFSKE